MDLLSFIDPKWVLLYTTVVSTYLLFYVFIKGVRDIFDKTPETDDNAFEKTVTFLGKLSALLLKGKRPDAPAGTTVVPGDAKDATGTKIQ